MVNDYCLKLFCKIGKKSSKESNLMRMKKLEIWEKNYNKKRFRYNNIAQLKSKMTDYVFN